MRAEMHGFLRAMTRLHLRWVTMSNCKFMGNTIGGTEEAEEASRRGGIFAQSSSSSSLPLGKSRPTFFLGCPGGRPPLGL